MFQIKQPIGQDPYMEIYDDLLDQIQVDQGQTLTITGEAGVGKSELIHAFKKRSTQKNIPTFTCSFVQSLDQNNVLKSFIEQLLQFKERHNIDFSLDQHSTWLGQFIGSQKLHPPSTFISQEDSFHLFCKSLQSLIHELSRDHAIVLMFEDVHWVSQDFVELISQITQNIENQKLLLVLSMRNLREFSFLLSLNHTHVPIKLLDIHQTHELIKTMLNVQFIDRKSIEHVFQYTKGNPLYTIELVQLALHNKNFHFSHDDPTHITASLITHQLSIPKDVTSIMLERFESFPMHVKTALQWACVLGHKANTDELKSLLQERMPQHTHETLDFLFKEKHLLEVSAFPQNIHCFKHDIFYESIKKTISPEQQVLLNNNIAWFLLRYHKDDVKNIAWRLSNHFYAGHEVQAATTYSLQAGHSSLEFFNTSQALFYFTRAHACWNQNQNKTHHVHEIFEPLVDTLIETGHLKKANDMLRSWHNLGHFSQTEILLSHQFKKIKLHHLNEEQHEVLELCHSMLDDPKMQNHYDWIVSNVASMYIHALNEQKQFALAHEKATSFIKTLKKHPSHLTSLIQRLAHSAYGLNNIPQSQNHLQKAFKLLSAHAPPSLHIELYTQAMILLLKMNHPKEAKTLAIKAVQKAKEHHLKKHLVIALKSLSHFYLSTHHLAQSIETLQDTIQAAKDIEDEQNALQAKLLLTKTFIHVGASDDAKHVHHQIDLHDFNHWPKDKQTMFLQNKYWLLLMQNKTQQAIECAQNMEKNTLAKLHSLHAQLSLPEPELSIHKQLIELQQSLDPNDDYVRWFHLMTLLKSLRFQNVSEVPAKDFEQILSCPFKSDILPLCLVHLMHIHESRKEFEKLQVVKDHFFDLLNTLSYALSKRHKADLHTHPLFNTF